MKRIRSKNIAFVFLMLIHLVAFAQPKAKTERLPDSLFIRRYDTLLHLQSWISANQMEYRFYYTKDFKLILSPNDINNFSVGFSYRYLDLGLSFTPQIMNSNQDRYKKGESDRFSLGFGFSMHQFHLAFDFTTVKGFYLRNSADFGIRNPDSPYILFPSLRVGYFSTLLSYNVNPKFSTAAMAGGTQVQKRSAITVTPTFQFATFRFSTDIDSSGVQAETTYSTDLNILLPFLGTYVLSPKFSTTLGLGPSLGMDFFKSISRNADDKIIVSKGNALSSGYVMQFAVAYNSERFFSGFEYRYRIYGHHFEQLDRLEKQYSYYQIYFGWRLKPPGFAKKSLDWANKISPIKFE